MASFTYRLPFPPSTNSYIRHTSRGHYPTKQAKEFRQAVCESVVVPRVLRGRLAVHLELIAPTKRKYDVDNRIKSCLDALQIAGVFLDDEQIDELRVTRLHVEAPGACDVTIVEIGG